MKRRIPNRGQCPDIFGPWVGILALTASKTEPHSKAERDRIHTRIHSGLENIATGATPHRESWRDLTDAMNFLQSAVEKGWAVDEDGAISAAKAALEEGAANFAKHGKVRMSAPSLGSMRNLLEQFDATVDSISANSYWKLVAHTRNRVNRILHGARRHGDVVVSL